MNEPETNKFAFTVTGEVDANDLMNLVVNAFDSGVTNYWANSAVVVLPEGFDVTKIPWLKDPEEWESCSKSYIAPFVEGGKVVLLDNEEEDKKYVLDLAAIRRGVEIMSSKYRRHWADFREENDDADTADVFIQCCVMGEVVFS